ncbi:UNVERIFIED_CONTAM: hypothetical protein K2H54_021082, partial [Gekko kuhli]
LWQSVHIDDLRRSKDMVSDITVLRNVTISQLFLEHKREPAGNLEFALAERADEDEMEVEGSIAAEQEKNSTQVLDTTILLKTCVQSAVGMLRDQNEGCNRSTRRIEILLSLLCEADSLKASFLKITKSRLLSHLEEQEENSCTMKEWVLRSASNLSALQEAGTFRRTLWKRVQNVVTPSLAYIVSVIDRDANLDLLVKPATENCVKAVWMFIFNDLKLLNIPYVIGQGSSQTETILVQNYFQGTVSDVNEMPFSWRIKDYLEDLWAQAQYITGDKGHKEKFIDIFQQTPLGKYLAEFSEKENNILFHCYLRDFILLTTGVSSRRELEFLQMALLSCIEEMKAASSSAEQNVLPLPWIHLGYCQYRSRLQNFSRILAVYPDVVSALTGYAKREGSIPCHQMVLDVLAALACTEMLEGKLLKCKPQIWLQQVKNLQMPVELVCTASDLKSDSGPCGQLLQQVRSHWNQVFTVSLFVEHVLLGVETVMPEMQNLVKKYTSHLLKSCIKQLLVPAQMLCPFCLASLPDDYTLDVSKELGDIITKYSKFRKFCNSFFIDLVSTMCFKDNEPPEKAVIQELFKLLFAHKEVLRGCQEGKPSVHTKSLSPFDDVVDKTPVIRSVVLKLLLKYSFNNVKAFMQDYLSQVENWILGKDDKTELYTLFVNCLEDSMCEKSGVSAEEIKTAFLRDDGHFLANYFQWNSQDTPQEVSIEYLQGVARIRMCLDRAAELLYELHGTARLQLQELLLKGVVDSPPPPPLREGSVKSAVGLPKPHKSDKHAKPSKPSSAPSDRSKSKLAKGPKRPSGSKSASPTPKRPKHLGSASTPTPTPALTPRPHSESLGLPSDDRSQPLTTPDDHPAQVVTVPSRSPSIYSRPPSEILDHGDSQTDTRRDRRDWFTDVESGRRTRYSRSCSISYREDYLPLSCSHRYQRYSPDSRSPSPYTYTRRYFASRDRPDSRLMSPYSRSREPDRRDRRSPPHREGLPPRPLQPPSAALGAPPSDPAPQHVEPPLYMPDLSKPTKSSVDSDDHGSEASDLGLMPRYRRTMPTQNNLALCRHLMDRSPMCY